MVVFHCFPDFFCCIPHWNSMCLGQGIIHQLTADPSLAVRKPLLWRWRNRSRGGTVDKWFRTKSVTMCNPRLVIFTYVIIYIYICTCYTHLNIYVYIYAISQSWKGYLCILLYIYRWIKINMHLVSGMRILSKNWQTIKLFPWLLSHELNDIFMAVLSHWNFDFELLGTIVFFGIH